MKSLSFAFPKKKNNKGLEYMQVLRSRQLDAFKKDACFKRNVGEKRGRGTLAHE